MSRVFVQPLKSFTPGGPIPPVVIPITVDSLFFPGFSTVALTPQGLVPAGGTPPYSYSAVGLPAGVSIDVNTGIISGTPTATGVTTATATVTDSLAAFVSIPIFFEILPGTFGDDFNRANGALGPRWGQVRGGTGAINSVNGNRLLITGGSVVFDAQQFTMSELMNVYGTLFGLRQFATVLLVSTTATGVGTSITPGGPTVFNDSGLFTSSVGTFMNCYMCYMQAWPGQMNMQITKWVNGVISGGFGTTPLAFGDVVGIRAQVLDAATVRVELLRNGAVVFTVDDVSATRKITGIPGFGMQACGITTLTLDDYVCGTF